MKLREGRQWWSFLKEEEEARSLELGCRLGWLSGGGCRSWGGASVGGGGRSQ